MNRDDYISKLFIQNQNKLEKAPSADLWTKIEAQLPAKEAVIPSRENNPIKVVSLTKYWAAAASVALLLSVSVYWVQSNKNPSNEELALAEAQDLPKLMDYEREEEEILPITKAEKKEILEKEDKLQESKIRQRVKEETNSIEIKIADKIKDISLEEVATTSTIAKSNKEVSAIEITSNSALLEVEKNTIVASQNRYAPAPPINTIINQRIATEIVQNNNNNINFTKSSPIRKSKGRLAKKSKKAKKSKTNSSPMAMAHPRLQMFGWMLGKWIDKNETNGKAYETWQLKNSYTLQGKGFKVSMNNERIFEEIMYIEYRADANQVFLIFSLGENEKKIAYMLTQFDNERITFSQSASTNYPDELIIQRDLDGFTTILVHNQGFLNGDQQRYLENRNRVSNVRAIRTLHYSK